MVIGIKVQGSRASGQNPKTPGCRVSGGQMQGEPKGGL